ncbi:MAG: thioredoxin family protein [Deltaproteobacteria bacterium]|nr:thioredoxin family protein [Deltaproteobacteria bacterium]
MTPEEKKQIIAFSQKLAQVVDVRLTTSDDARSRGFEIFGRELAENASKVQVRIEKNPVAGSMPGLHIASSLVYHAIPHGTELPPFLDMLADVSEKSAETSAAGAHREPEFPAKLKLYVSSTCTFCPAVVRKLCSLVLQKPHIQLTIIDGVLFFEMADTDHIRSVPTLILDDRFRWTGTVDHAELLNTIQNRNPSQLSADTFAAMISDGDAYRLAEMMLKEECIFPAFIDLLTHEAFSTRLGAMAAAEEIVERRMSLAVHMAAPLAQRFEQQGDAVKGDILYIIGAAGDYRSLGFLNKISAGDYSKEVKEAAEDALKEIRSR